MDENRVKYFPNLLVRQYVKRNIYFSLKGEKKPVYKSTWPQEFLRMFCECLELKSNWCRTNIKHSKNLNIIYIFQKIFKNFSFGNSLNKKTFFRIIHIITTGSKSECIFLSCLSSRFNLNAIPWLEGVSNKTILMQDCIRRLLNEIVIPLFNTLYKPLIFGKQHQIRLYPERLIKQFVTKSLNRLRSKNHLVPKETWDSNSNKCRGQLVIRSKSGLDPNNIRPILYLNKNNSYKRCLPKIRRKQINKALFHYALELGCARVDCFYTNWKQFTEYIGNHKLYGVKLDLTDCYGSIDLDKLKTIIQDIPNSKLKEDYKRIILDLLKNYYVHCGPNKESKNCTYWEWKRGLLQGDYFSGPLCEVYLSHHENLLLKGFITPGSFLYRKVDDYLFCSIKVEEVHRFMEAIKSFMKINISKSELVLGDKKCCVGYCGKIINLDTKEIKVNIKFEKNTQFHTRFKLWNSKLQLAQRGLIAKALYFPYNNFYFQKVFLNVDYNSEKVVLKNFFFGMVLMAFKLDSTVMSITLQKMNSGYNTGLLQAIDNTVTYYSYRAAVRLEGKSFTSTYRNFVNVGYNAFIVVFKRRSLSYADIILELNKSASKFYSTFDIKPFTRLPKQFENICMKRKFQQINE